MIEDFHQTILAAVKEPGSLDMNDWHTCETVHCWAGHIVNCTGKEGYDLESKTSTLFAAMQINKASSAILISPNMFFESNEVALANMKRFAEMEREGKR